jgi:hypothetical protein
MAAHKGNKYALGNNGGRPALFNSPEELQRAIDDYFDYSGTTKKLLTPKGVTEITTFTISGLVYHLGFEALQSFYDYEKREEFSYTIKRARLRIQMIYEENLQFSNPTGSIFALKNFGWVDKTEIDHTVNVAQLPTINIRTKESAKD